MNKKFVVLLVLAFLMVIAVPSYALDLVESKPKNADQGVALDSEIYLLFDKNVVNFKIKDNNARCFTLLDDRNQVVPIEVIFADDQIEPEKRNEITVKPQELLKSGTTYKLEVSPELQAKNGTSLEKKLAISFVTAK